MPDSADSTVDYAAAFKLARRQPIQFVLVMGGDEGLVFEWDRRRPTKTLMRNAKERGGTQRGAMGTLTLEGRVASLHCINEKVPSSLPKRAKKFFNSKGYKYKFQMHLPGGEVIGDEDEEEAAAEADGVSGSSGQAAEEDGTAESSADGGNQDALREKLIRAFRAMNDQLRSTIAATEPPTARRLSTLAKSFGAEVKGGDLRKAGAMLTLLKKTMAQAGAEAAAGGEAAETDDTAGQLADDPGVTGEGGMDGGTPIPNGGVGTPGGVADAPAGGDLSDDEGVPDTPAELFELVRQRFSAFWDELMAPTEGDVARDAEQQAIADQEDRIRSLYGQPYDPAIVRQIQEETARLHNMIETSRQIAQLGPEAATQARQAMASFDGDLGPGTEVTPELMAEIDAEIAAAEAAEQTASEHLSAAEALPDGPEKEAATEAAMQEMMTATVALDTARGRSRAATGKRLLTEAITTGPLSPEAVFPFSDQSAAQFIEAYEREPELADFAADHASTAQNRDTIADGMGMLVDNMATGFAAASGNQPQPPFDASAYARDLVRGAGAAGGEYFEDAEAYVRSGGTNARNPIPNDGRRVNSRERARSNFISDAVMARDGTIDVSSDGAREALGHLRFNPDVISNPTPALNAHIVGRYDVLSDETNRERAQETLRGMGAPRGAGQALVARSTGRRDDVGVSDEDGRQAVMSAFMTPVHQGPVGSCFATAGVRRMSMLDPVESLERYAELAETGQFRPRNASPPDGPDPIPAILNFGLDQNPLIRSLEYSAATVMTQLEENSRRELLDDALVEAIDGLEDVAESGETDWSIDAAVIRATLESSFTVEYDANRRTAPSADGSSSRGVYVLVQVDPARNVIDSKPGFVAALTERVQHALEVEPDSDRGRAISTEIAKDDYLDELMSGSRAPWNLGGGGMPEEADEVLFGNDREMNAVSGGRTGWDDFVGATSGDMTEDLLEDLLEAFEDHQGESMLPLMNRGIHAFNGLPDHPSLATLRSGDVEDNIERLITDPAAAMSREAISAERADEMLSEAVTVLKEWEGTPSRIRILDRAVSAGLGLEDGNASAVNAAIVAALQDWRDQAADDLADRWQSRDASRDDAARDSERDRLHRIFGNMVDSAATGGVLREMPVDVFTVADTNWGDAEQDYNFVVIPDPITGEARMMKQSLPSGRLEPLDEKYVNARWSEIVPAD